MTDKGDTFGKAIPCPPGAFYRPRVALPRPMVKAIELSPEERAARRKASEQGHSLASAYHVSLLDAGMKSYLALAKQKWLAAGGYGFPLTPEEEAEIRAAGFEPARRDP